MGGPPKPKSREQLSPTNQQVYDAAAKSVGLPSFSFWEGVSKLKERADAGPPAPPDFSSVQDAGMWERRRRMGGSRSSSFITGQGAADAFLTNPKTLLGGG